MSMKVHVSSLHAPIYRNFYLPCPSCTDVQVNVSTKLLKKYVVRKSKHTLILYDYSKINIRFSEEL